MFLYCPVHFVCGAIFFFTVTVMMFLSGSAILRSTSDSPFVLSLESARNSCITSLSPRTVTEHTFSRYSSRPLRLASNCCSESENGHFLGSFGKWKSENSRFKFW